MSRSMHACIAIADLTRLRDASIVDFRAAELVLAPTCPNDLRTRACTAVGIRGVASFANAPWEFLAHAGVLLRKSLEAGGMHEGLCLLPFASMTVSIKRNMRERSRQHGGGERIVVPARLVVLPTPALALFVVAGALPVRVEQ